jgi:glycosyltransferase involved in cell wall biosynthesis
MFVILSKDITMAKISIIIPCYFNQDNIPATTEKLLEVEKMYPVGTDIEYVFVDDGSTDNTLTELLKFHYSLPERTKIIKLVANVGSYNAVLAGISNAQSDCIAVISADLQDPPELLPEMFGHWIDGHKLVLAHREKRNDPWIDKIFSNFFHKIIKKYAVRNIPEGGFDVVLFDKELQKELVRMQEKNTNIFYLMPFLGYKPYTIKYERRKRDLGKSMWTFQKKIKLLIDSFIAFSFLPIRIISILGLGLGILATLYACILIVLRLTGIITVEGWTAIMVVILFVSAFQMIAMGIIGEYVWRTLDTVRNRPIYLIDKIFSTQNTENEKSS